MTNNLENLLHEPGPVFFHADMFRVRKLLPRDIKKPQLLEKHFNILQEIANSRDLWCPTFNYEFPKTKLLDIQQSKSQIGPFSEYFRLNKASWRTEVPIFNVSGTKAIPHIHEGETTLLPFGEKSIFAKLVEEKGSLLFYGAKLPSITFIHYIEHVFGPPIYRYNKDFLGTIKNKENIKNIEITLYVRPWEMNLEYDWDKIYSDLEKAFLIKKVSGMEFNNIFCISAKDLYDFWGEQLKKDPFYFLDKLSLEWVSKLYKKLNRRFLQSDFERTLLNE
jgi:aminoglycoside N3'-acetyltransferase